MTLWGNYHISDIPPTHHHISSITTQNHTKATVLNRWSTRAELLQCEPPNSVGFEVKCKTSLEAGEAEGRGWICVWDYDFIHLSSFSSLRVSLT